MSDANYLLVFGFIQMLSAYSMAEKQLIAVSLPGKFHQGYYKNQLGGTMEPVVEMFSEYSYKVAEAGDQLLIFYEQADEDLLDSVTFHHRTLFMCLHESLDLWMRDFPNTVPDLLVKFKYRPDYLRRADARATETEFTNMLRSIGITLPENQKSTLIIDGGNIVENGATAGYKVVTTKRTLWDNYRMSEDQFKRDLARDLVRDGVEPTICLLNDQGDTTGHSDGLVAFLDEKTLLLCDYGYPEAYQSDLDSINRDFGDDVDVVRIACFDARTKKNGRDLKNFDSAAGAYINMLVSDNAVYVPQFGVADKDAAALETVRANTNKKVVGVNTGELAHMGGNVRCMSWQMYESTDIAQALLENSFFWTDAKKKQSDNQKTVDKEGVNLLRMLLKELKNL